MINSPSTLNTIDLVISSNGFSRKSAKDTIVYSEQSDYAANIEKAEVVYVPNEKHDEIQPLSKIETPNIHTYECLAFQFLITVEFHHVFHLVHKQLQLFQYLRHSHFVHYRQSYLWQTFLRNH